MVLKANFNKSYTKALSTFLPVDWNYKEDEEEGKENIRKSESSRVRGELPFSLLFPFINFA